MGGNSLSEQGTQPQDGWKLTQRAGLLKQGLVQTRDAHETARSEKRPELQGSYHLSCLDGGRALCIWGRI